MNWYTNLRMPLLLAAIMVVGVTGPTFAQNAPPVDLCGNPAGAVAQNQPPNYNGYPYDYPSDAGGADNKPSEPPQPVNPVRKVCEGGKVEILLGNSRHYGYRIGDHVRITVLVRVDENVVVDFSSLKQKKISFTGSDFELVEEPTVRSQPAGDGKVLHRIDLTVQSWVPMSVAPPEESRPGGHLIFNLDLRYATELAADGKTPVWKVLTTPDFVVSGSNTVDHGTGLLEGDLDAKTPRNPWPTMPLLIAGFFLVLFFPGLMVVKYLNRIIPRKKVPQHVAAWRAFDKVMASTRDGGFKVEHYAGIEGALRTYLQAVTGKPIEAATILEIRDFLDDHAQLAEIDTVISLCERAIYLGETISDEENWQIIKGFEALVPRPWDSK